MYDPTPLNTDTGEQTMKFFAQTAANHNDIAASEARSIGAETIRIVPGGIQFQGDLETGYRFCLWTRVSSRVLLELEPANRERAPIAVKDKDSLYDAASAIAWNEHITTETTFAVTATAKKAGWLKNSQFGAIRVKDAIVDHMRHLYHERPDVDSEDPDVGFHIHIDGKQAIFYLDFSGRGLHKRGYRTHQSDAMLKEHLAAAILSRSGWNSTSPSHQLFLDPFCGMGTLPIEAAMIAADIAPGLLSSERFGFLKWQGHIPAVWERVLREAEERRSTQHPMPKILAWDIDSASIEYAKEHAKLAGVEQYIQFQCRDFTHMREEIEEGSTGIIVTDPPYGIRMGNEQGLHTLYARTGELMQEYFPGWKINIFCGSTELLDDLRLRPSSVHTLFNGPIQCSLTRYDIFDRETREEMERKAEEKRRARLESPLSEQAQMCLNRLKKNKRMLKSFLQKENITSYRLYDADIPEYSAAVDIYEDRWVHVQEYAAPRTIDESTAKRHLSELIDAVNRATGIDYEHIFVKQRRQQKGSNQYNKLASKGTMYIMKEHGLKFLVNFTDYLDTGIFLDHRTTRNMIKEMSENCRFLNLFAYTGTATVHAAAGGALSTVTVDASSTYLSWAEKNMELNGFTGMNHFYYRSDCIKWLKSNRDRFDLIFLDPPTFSNSKSRKEAFDIQHDHSTLIKLAMSHLTPNGTLIFSNNFRRFVLDRYLENRFLVEEITDKTIPQDFQRNRKIHRCWTIRPKRIVRSKNKKKQLSSKPTRVIRKKHIEN